MSASLASISSSSGNSRSPNVTNASNASNAPSSPGASSPASPSSSRPTTGITGSRPSFGFSSSSSADTSSGPVKVTVLCEDESRYRLGFQFTDSIKEVKQYLEKKAKLLPAKILIFFPDKLGESLADSVTLQDLLNRVDHPYKGTQSDPLCLFLIKNRGLKIQNPLRIRLFESKQSEKAYQELKDKREKEKAAEKAEKAAAAVNAAATKEKEKEKEKDKNKDSAEANALAAALGVQPTSPASAEKKKEKKPKGTAVIKGRGSTEEMWKLNAAAPSIMFFFVEQSMSLIEFKGRVCEKMWSLNDLRDWRPEFVKLRIRKGKIDNPLNMKKEEEKKEQENQVEAEAEADGQASVETSQNGKDSVSSNGDADEKDIELDVGDQYEFDLVNSDDDAKSLQTIGFQSDIILEYSFSPPYGHQIGKRFDVSIEDVRKRVYKVSVHELMPIRIVKQKFFALNRNRKHWEGMKYEYIRFKTSNGKIKDENCSLKDFGIVGPSKMPQLSMSIKMPSKKCSIL